MANGEDAVAYCRKNSPNIVLMDMNMPGIGGMEATKKILHFNPGVKVLAFTTHCENPLPANMMQIGANGSLTKGPGPDEMLNAIRTVHSGTRHIAPEIAQQMALNICNNQGGENLFQSLS